MKVSELRQLLRRAPEHELATALQELDAALSEIGELDVDQLVDAIRPAIAKLKKAVHATEAKKPALNSVSVAHYVRELERTRTDARAFEDVLARVRKDKGVKVGDAKEMARLFVGGPQKYKSKAEALEAILRRQISDLRQAARRSQVPDLF